MAKFRHSRGMERGKFKYPSRNVEIKAVIKNALMHGMDAALELSKEGERVELVLVQHPSHRTALYPDFYTSELAQKNANWMFEELMDLVGTKNTCKDADCVLDIIGEMERRGFRVKPLDE